MEAQAKKIIIDTDIGDDIDDAFAIALAANSPELDLIGVTTVFRNAQRRARMCKALLRSCGREEIPVFAGVNRPLVHPEPDHGAYDASGAFIPCQFTPDMEEIPYDGDQAVAYLIDTVRCSPGEVTLVPIGPLTNIAMAIRLAPDLVEKVAGVTLMGGCYDKDTPEWNILCDPEAARIVYSSGIPLRGVGLDVTLQCRLEGERLKRFQAMNAGAAGMLNTMMEHWFHGCGLEGPVLHDPLAVGTLVDPSFVRFERRNILVGLEGDEAGRTRTAPEGVWGAAPVETASEVDAARYLEFFCQRLFA